MKLLDQLGGPNTYEHYPTGWAAALSTPFKMFKRYSNYAGGTECPLTITWPKGIKARGEIRNQYYHAVDIVPTILDIVGLEMPKVYHGIDQIPLSGVSMRSSFEAKPDAPTNKHVQYYTMLGTRAIWQDGWKAVAVHASLTSKGHFDRDNWELYHVDVDRSESNDLAKQFPEKLEAMKKLWDSEADKNFAKPLEDRGPREVLGIYRPKEEEDKDAYTYYPHTSQVPEAVAVNIRGKSYKIISNIDIKANASGVIFAHGSRFGGHSLFIKDHKLYYAYNFLGITEQQLVSTPLTAGKYTVGAEFVLDKAGEHGESMGTMKLYVNNKMVAQKPMKVQSGKFTLSGDGLCVGWDSGDAVSKLYKSPGEFQGGTIHFVTVSTGKEKYSDLQTEAARAMSTE